MRQSVVMDANDRTGELEVVGDPDEVKEALSIVELFDVRPAETQLKLILSNRLATKETRLTMSNLAPVKVGDDFFGSYLELVSRINEDGTITLTVKSLEDGRKEASLVLRVKLRTLNEVYLQDGSLFADKEKLSGSSKHDPVRIKFWFDLKDPEADKL